MKKEVLVISIVVLVLVGAWFFWLKPRPMNLEFLNQLPSEEKDYYATLISGVRSGGPSKDGIPAIDKPQYESALQANTWLKPNDVVFGVDYNGKVVAYPQRILVWHEIVNDRFEKESISVTYCPLTGTAIGYKAHGKDLKNPTFGISGKLVNSNLIMYDRETDSYWPQILGQAITGSKTKTALEQFPVVWTTWEQWKKEYPETQVLSQNTGFFRDYRADGDPYGSYLSQSGYYFKDQIIFSPVYSDTRLSPKTVVIGLRDSQRNAVAILKDALRQKKKIEITLGGRLVEVVYDQDFDFYSAQYQDIKEKIYAFDAFWFAWHGFYPNTELIQE